MAPGQHILVCEPQFGEFQHAKFNAALLVAGCLAFDRCPALFFGAQPHMSHVRSVLRDCPPDPAPEVRWIEVPVRSQMKSTWTRTRVLYQTIKRVLDFAADNRSRAVIFCSLNAQALFVLKLLLASRRGGCPVLVALHNLYELLQPDRGLVNRLFCVRNVLRLPAPPNLRLLILSESIYRQALPLGLPRQRCTVIDHPFLWPPPPATKPPPGDKVRFGFVGITYKGFSSFVDLARQIVPRYPQGQFVLVGHALPPVPPDAERYVAGCDTKPLSEQEFNDRLRSLTYVLWTAEYDRYRLTASASFLDALAAGKPGIYLANPYVEHYFERMGDIGYLCRTMDDVTRQVEAILRDFPAERYRRQTANILKNRHIFDPAVQARRLREAVLARPPVL